MSLGPHLAQAVKVVDVDVDKHPEQTRQDLLSHLHEGLREGSTWADGDRRPPPSILRDLCPPVLQKATQLLYLGQKLGYIAEYSCCFLVPVKPPLRSARYLGVAHFAPTDSSVFQEFVPEDNCARGRFHSRRDLFLNPVAEWLQRQLPRTAHTHARRRRQSNVPLSGLPWTSGHLINASSNAKPLRSPSCLASHFTCGRPARLQHF